jgi:hypothetical protein
MLLENNVPAMPAFTVTPDGQTIAAMVRFTSYSVSVAVHTIGTAQSQLTVVNGYEETLLRIFDGPGYLDGALHFASMTGTVDLLLPSGDSAASAIIQFVRRVTSPHQSCEPKQRGPQVTFVHRRVAIQ